MIRARAISRNADRKINALRDSQPRGGIHAPRNSLGHVGVNTSRGSTAPPSRLLQTNEQKFANITTQARYHLVEMN